MIPKDLIFIPFKIYCAQCDCLITVSIESLHDKEDAVCPNCNFVNKPDIDVDSLLKLIKRIEDNADNIE